MRYATDGSKPGRPHLSFCAGMWTATVWFDRPGNRLASTGLTVGSAMRNLAAWVRKKATSRQQQMYLKRNPLP